MFVALIFVIPFVWAESLNFTVPAHAASPVKLNTTSVTNDTITNDFSANSNAANLINDSPASSDAITSGSPSGSSAANLINASPDSNDAITSGSPSSSSAANVINASPDSSKDNTSGSPSSSSAANVINASPDSSKDITSGSPSGLSATNLSNASPSSNEVIKSRSASGSSAANLINGSPESIESITNGSPTNSSSAIVINATPVSSDVNTNASSIALKLKIDRIIFKSAQGLDRKMKVDDAHTPSEISEKEQKRDPEADDHFGAVNGSNPRNGTPGDNSTQTKSGEMAEGMTSEINGEFFFNRFFPIFPEYAPVSNDISGKEPEEKHATESEAARQIIKRPVKRFAMLRRFFLV